MQNVLVVFNPEAGHSKALVYKEKLVKFFEKRNITYKIVSLINLSTDEFKNIDSVIVLGGDGTINKVVPFIQNTEISLGIVPCGTANLLAAKLGFSSNFKKNLQILEQEKFQKIDVMNINDRKSILRFGMGYDANIVTCTPQKLKKYFGYFAYFLAGIIFALRLKQKKYVLNFDNRKITVLASCIIIANAGNMYKNLVSISNNCKLDDGLLDVFILKTKNPILFFAEFIQIIFNIKNDNSKAMYFKSSEVNINNIFSTVHIDGEKIKIRGDINFNISPKSVKVYTK